MPYSPSCSRACPYPIGLLRFISRVVLATLLLVLPAPWHLVAAAQPQNADSASNPIVPGDHPDPTIIRVGSTYYTASTSGDWAPVFPLFRSNDLRHWTAAGAIFPTRPAWASGSFWAPELVYDGGRVLLYYVGRKRGGPLCVAVASAEDPGGPFTDHGPLVCQHDGSIDPAMARDEHGRPFLIWKEDGNSIHQPTPLWAQPLTDDLLHLTGTPTLLLVNDPATWEGNVVEAPYIMHHDGHFYLFYAGNACCGVGCHYAEGLARADHLLGPWIRDPANPIIRPNGTWICPGHGTAVETPTGDDYFLYHAYPANGTVYVGRESVLDRITWTPDGWPVVNNGAGPHGEQTGSAASTPAVSDDFPGPTLDPAWEWPATHPPQWQIRDHTLTIADPSHTPAFVARSLPGSEYTASVAVKHSGGIAIIGGMKGEVTLYRRGNHLRLLRLTRNQHETLWHTKLSGHGTLWLRVSSSDLSHAQFAYSEDQTHWTLAGPALNVTDLLPWDQGLRVGLVNAVRHSTAAFGQFSLAATGPVQNPAAQ